MSVSSDPLLPQSQDKDSKRVYLRPYTDTELWLESEYHGAADYTGLLYKHGCTQDVRQLWRDAGIELRASAPSDDMVEQALVRYGLQTAAAGPSTSEMQAGVVRRRRQEAAAAAAAEERARKRRATSARAVGSEAARGHNSHLAGTDFERKVQEAAEQRRREEGRL